MQVVTGARNLLGGLLIGVILAGCQVDLGFDCNAIAGPYCLEKWEDGKTYYLCDKREYNPFDSHNWHNGGRSSCNDLVEGTVLRLAWTKTLIMVDRQAEVGGDPNGWMVINVVRQTVLGPISSDAAERLFSRYGIQPRSAEVAWSQLR